MLKKRIIPCLDVKNGRVVKGVKFEDLTDVGDPAELAVKYEAEGADEVVFLDISASRDGRDTTLDVVRRTAERLFIPLTVGGGIRTVDDMHEALASGADKVSVNTAAVLDPTILTQGAERFGSQCIVLAVDAKRIEGSDPLRWEIFTHGGSKPTGRDAIEWVVEGARRGAGEILLTSMDADGTKDGYDVPLLKAVTNAVKVPVIASGGAGCAAHLADAIEQGGADAALAASIFHYRETTVREVKDILRLRAVAVR